MSIDVINVNLATGFTRVAQQGFGIPMILSYNASFPERYRTYTSLDGLTDDGFATTSPEYLCAAAMFSQDTSPSIIAVGRGALAPTQSFTLNIDTLVADTDYSLVVEGDGVTTTTVTVNSASLTADLLIIDIATALNAVAGANFTATTGAGSDLILTGDAAGNWFSVAPVKHGQFLCAQDHADPGVSTDLAAIADENDGFYFIINPYNSEAMLNGVAAWAESNDKLFVAATSDQRSGSVATGGGDPMDDIKTSAYNRTAVIYHPSPADFADAAWVGKLASKDPGSVNWNYKTLAGVAAPVVTSSYRTNIEAKYGNYYTEMGGVNVTLGGGTVGSNEYIDVVRGKDWIEARLKENLFAMLAGSDKVPYTDAGISQVDAVVRSVLREASRRGIIDTNYTTSVPRVIDVTPADKASRILRNVNFTATLAGAINTINIQGTVSV